MVVPCILFGLNEAKPVSRARARCPRPCLWRAHARAYAYAVPTLVSTPAPMPCLRPRLSEETPCLFCQHIGPLKLLFKLLLKFLLKVPLKVPL